MNKLKCLLVLVLIVVCLSSCASTNSSYLEVGDGIRMGMTLREVDNVLSKADKTLSEYGITELKVADQPYAIVELSFLDNLESYDSTVVESSNTFLVNMMNDWNLDMHTSLAQNSALLKYDIKETNASKLLVQACVYFTSDEKYTTAKETFETVETFLKNKYGDTRYTSRRGESLPIVKGYEARHSIITRDTLNLAGNIIKSIDEYAQRVVKIENDKYLVIDHYIEFQEKDNTFVHCLVFSLIPQNIE